MLTELASDNEQFVKAMRDVHNARDEHGDVATASLLEVWIEEGERRVWLLRETAEPGA